MGTGSHYIVDNFNDLSRFIVMTCVTIRIGTANVGIKAHGRAPIVLCEVKIPKETAKIKSTMPRIFQTIDARFAHLAPLFKKYANGIAVTPIRMSPIPAGYANIGLNIPTDEPHRNTTPPILHV